MESIRSGSYLRVVDSKYLRMCAAVKNPPPVDITGKPLEFPWASELTSAASIGSEAKTAMSDTFATGAVPAHPVISAAQVQSTLSDKKSRKFRLPLLIRNISCLPLSHLSDHPRLDCSSLIRLMLPNQKHCTLATCPRGGSCELSADNGFFCVRRP